MSLFLSWTAVITQSVIIVVSCLETDSSTALLLALLEIYCIEDLIYLSIESFIK